MTRKNFDDAIISEYNTYVNAYLLKEKGELIEYACFISKLQHFKDFCLNVEDEFVEPLYQFADDGVLNMLCDAEMDFDTAHFTTWDDCKEVVNALVENER